METIEAIRRVEMILPMLRLDIRSALLSHTVMKAMNDTVPKKLEGLKSEFNSTYYAIQNALVLKLSMDLSRLFDISNTVRFKAETQEKASIPVLFALLSREDVRLHFIDKARQWIPGISNHGNIESNLSSLFTDSSDELQNELRSSDQNHCAAAIADFLELASLINCDGNKEKEALIRVREFRNRRLAHSLFDKTPDKPPRYSDLDLLLEVAKEAAKLASMAVEGLGIDLEEEADLHRESAVGFSNCLVNGLKIAEGHTIGETDLPL
jgi:hypothetical protein